MPRWFAPVAQWKSGVGTALPQLEGSVRKVGLVPGLTNHGVVDQGNNPSGSLVWIASSVLLVASSG